jgi:hypothetical protein
VKYSNRGRKGGNKNAAQALQAEIVNLEAKGIAVG